MNEIKTFSCNFKKFIDAWYELAFNINKMPLNRYQQKCRVYLDEYPEQEKLRENYLENSWQWIRRKVFFYNTSHYEFKNEELIKKVLIRKKTNEWFKEIAKANLEKYFGTFTQKNPYEHFKIRFMRRQ